MHFFHYAIGINKFTDNPFDSVMIWTFVQIQNISSHTADNLSNAKPAVNFRFRKEDPQKVNKQWVLAFESRLFELKWIFLILKNAILSFLYWFLRAPKDMVRCFLVVVIFLPSRETPVKMRKIWDKNDDILLVLTNIA